MKRRGFLASSAAALAAPAVQAAGDSKLLKFVPQADIALLDPHFSSALVMQLLRQAVIVLFRAVGPILLVAMFLGVVVNVIQTNGPVFATEALTPDLNRINPAKGVQRFFSSRARSSRSDTSRLSR